MSLTFGGSLFPVVITGSVGGLISIIMKGFDSVEQKIYVLHPFVSELTSFLSHLVFISRSFFIICLLKRYIAWASTYLTANNYCLVAMSVPPRNMWPERLQK